MNLILLLVFGLLAFVLAALLSPLWLSLRVGAGLLRLWRWMFKPAPVDYSSALSPSEITSPRPLVVALHGTFAPHAEWTRPDSALAQAVAAHYQQAGQPCDWHCFVWTGANTVAARLEAINRLIAQLTPVFAQQPTRPVLLLGHSHGGNVALKVAQHFAAQPGLRLVTLATPFLVAQRRASGVLLMRVLPLVNVAVFALMAWVAISLAWPGHSWPGLVLFYAVFIAGMMRMPRSYQLAEDDIAELLQTVPDLGALEPLRERSLIVSRAGDEADGGLKLASLANSWIASAVRSSPSLADLQKLMIELQPYTTPEGQTWGKVLGLMWRAVRQIFWRESWWFRLIDLLSVWFGFVLLELLQSAVGNKAVVTSAGLIVSSSETPPGLWRHYQSVPSTDDAAVLLSHSQIYSDPVVINQVSQQLAAWPALMAAPHP